MTEIEVEQRSTEWYRLRRTVCVTASCFADAIGIGRGKPFDFLRFLVSQFDGLDNDEEVEEDSPSVYQAHGLRLEATIDSAYQILTGHVTKRSGFWIAEGDEGTLAGLIGASPDAKVFDASGERCIGLVEYKAPVHAMYRSGTNLTANVPRHHMAQIQGQMAVCGAEWCDYMAICTKTKEILLYRVYFEPSYWAVVSSHLRDFCSIVQTAKERHSRRLDALAFREAELLKAKALMRDLLPGENHIRVDNLLQEYDDGNSGLRHYRSQSETWMSYEFLVGEDPSDSFTES